MQGICSVPRPKHIKRPRHSEKARCPETTNIRKSHDSIMMQQIVAQNVLPCTQPRDLPDCQLAYVSNRFASRRHLLSTSKNQTDLASDQVTMDFPLQVHMRISRHKLCPLFFALQRTSLLIDISTSRWVLPGK